MGKIRQLDLQTANRIAAGEVVERPSSVIKELCDNALDAGASIITVEIVNGGIQLMRVTDNGSGMDAEDAKMAFVAHATSKLVKITDLDKLVTMGFRGEALASIASVSKIELITRQPADDHATKVMLEAGHLVDTSIVGAPVGTSITVADLFYNTPARFKFLKKDVTEASKIVEIVERLALSRPDVSFKLLQNGKTTLHTPGNNDLNSAVFAVFGGKIAQDLMTVKTDGQTTIQLEGLIGQPGAARNTRAWQLVFVNQRPIKSPIISHAIDEAYRGRLMKGKYPFALLNLRLPQNLVDINVHPQKLEVRFWDQNEVYRTIYNALKLALEEHILPPGDWNSVQENKTAVNRLETTDLPLAGLPPFKGKHRSNEQPGASEGDILASAYPSVSVAENPTEDYAFNLPHSNQEANDDAATTFYTENTGTATISATQNISIDKDISINSAFASDFTSPERQQLALPLPQDEGFGFPEEEQAVLRLSKLPIIGQAFRTYIMLEEKDKLWLVDQHAAHEKILFEKLYANFKAGQQQVQPLLVPMDLELKYSDKQCLFEHQAMFERLGYQFEDFGAQSILLRAVPAAQQQMDAALGLFAVLDYLQNDHEIEREDWLDHQAYDILAEVACKAAIKGNDALGIPEQKALLEELEKLNQPYNCPHGRPVVIMISKYELEKKFKRVL